MGASILFFVVHDALVAVLQSKETELGGPMSSYQVFSIEATTPGQLELLRDLYLSGDYDFWTTPSVLGYTDVMVAPEQIKGIVTISNNAKMKYIIKIADFETLVSKERIANLKAGSGRISWDRYPRFAEVNANINGREWVTGATATWIINELITNTTTYLDVLQQIDIHIIPMVNPDAYEISHTEDRLWTKTRSINDGSDCLGSDPNRNFAFMTEILKILIFTVKPGPGCYHRATSFAQHQLPNRKCGRFSWLYVNYMGLILRVTGTSYSARVISFTLLQSEWAGPVMTGPKIMGSSTPLLSGCAAGPMPIFSHPIKLSRMRKIKGRDKFQGFIDANRLPITLSE
ncbi:Zinc carboxypeptidase [Folsomia candida]|uniref:Zinc carboxypeptidase n=1 Tax=Folsomia candida TaxID=158441 RepID=A0A226DQ64_FOLCA|nr:Zinc carboxypeptidase [Folsomia candida]